MTDALETLLASVRACRICRDRPTDGRSLPHEPRPVVQASATARVCISGQAPGRGVHASGIPFDDPSGERLRDWLAVDRETFYDSGRIALVPMGFCFPGQDPRGADLPPRRECAPAWRQELFAQLPGLEVLIVVGRYALAWHLGAGNRASLTATVAAWREIYAVQARPKLIPLPHPSWRNNAWIRRHPWFEAELLPHLRQTVAGVLRR